MKYILLVTLAWRTFQSVLPEGNVYSKSQGQGLEKETQNDCDMVVREQFGHIVTPGYPGKYPRYSRCLYTVYRFSPDVCEIKLTMERFDVAKMIFSNCSEDFLEIQNKEKRYKLCGELPAGSKKFVFFPNESDRLVFKFQSTFHQKKGFSIEIKQLPYSCKQPGEVSKLEKIRLPPPCMQIVGGRIGRITFPDFTDDNLPIQRCTYTIKKSEDRACVVQLDFSSFEVTQSDGCETDYLKLPNGQRLCGILGGARKLLQFSAASDEIKLEFVSSANNGNSFDIQVAQLPGPCDYGLNTTGQTAQQCDQTVTGREGRITSPAYPSPFGPNFRCAYMIFRQDPSVCQIEMNFLHFNVGKHNPPTCSTGAYLEFPGKNRLCHDMDGKMILKIPEFKDPTILYFQSDSQSSGRGFDIRLKQIPNTCSGHDVQPEIPNASRRCYQEVKSYSGYFSSYRVQPHITSQRPMWCEFVVHRVDPSVCRFKLQISARNFHLLPCASNFVQLPNGEKMCISVTEKREVWFPKEAEFITLVYHNTHNPEFNLFVDQISNTCTNDNVQSQRLESKDNHPGNLYDYEMYGIFK